MAILGVSPYITGTIGNVPNMVFINTNDAPGTVVTAGYLTKVVEDGSLSVTSKDVALVQTTSGSIWYQILITGVAGSRSYSLGALAYPPQIFAGDVQAGQSGVAGGFISYPLTASKGSFQFRAVANTGDTVTTLSNAAMGQASVISIPDPANAVGRLLIGATATPFVSGNFPVNSGTAGLMVDSGRAANVLLYAGFATPDTNSNIVAFSVTCGQAALAAAGHVVLYTSSAAKQYRIVSLFINSGGTAFSGGGGDRLGQVSDGTTVYSVVPAANLQTLTNNGWGSTPLPYPAAAAINTLTAAGASLYFAYSGGTTDYTAGSVVISGVLQRIA